MRKWIYITAGVLLAALLSQFPEFHQQYRQRLGGTLDELTRQVEALDQRAAQTNMTRFNYIRHLQASEDEPARLEGGHLENLLVRHFSVSEAIQTLDNAHVGMIFLNVIYFLDVETAKATAEDYKPAVPLTMEGAIYAAIGFVWGYILMAFLMVFLPKRVLISEET